VVAYYLNDSLVVRKPLISCAGAPGEDKPKKKKSKRDCLQALKKQKNDPNAPGPTRMPFPDLKDVDKAERAKALKEMTRRQTLSAGWYPDVRFTEN
jgi:hypothetical protein